MPDIPSISIFLAGSLVENRAERDRVAASIADWNRYFFDSWGIMVRVYRAENESSALSLEGKQSHLNDYIASSDIAYFTIGRHVGEHTRSELRLAQESFAATGHPRIYVCVRDMPDADYTVSALVDDLLANNQYCFNYASTSELLLQIRDSLGKEVKRKEEESRLRQKPTYNRRKERLVVADSNLIVVRAFIHGARFKEVLPAFRIRYSAQEWGARTLDFCESGKAVFGVANHNDIVARQAENPQTPLVSLGTIGYSMGGKNLAILAHRAGAFADVTDLASFKRRLEGAHLAIGMKTDRLRGFLTIIGEDEAWLRSTVDKIIDVEEPTLAFFDLDPSLVAVGGQNLRLEALESNMFRELVPFSTLDRKTQRILVRNAANDLIANQDLLERYGLDGEEVFGALYDNFSACARDDDLADDLIDGLIENCAFSTNDYDTREHLVRMVLYETYHIGAPEI